MNSFFNFRKKIYEINENIIFLNTINKEILVGQIIKQNEDSNYLVNIEDQIYTFDGRKIIINDNHIYCVCNNNLPKENDKNILKKYIENSLLSYDKPTLFYVDSIENGNIYVRYIQEYDINTFSNIENMSNNEVKNRKIKYSDFIINGQNIENIFISDNKFLLKQQELYKTEFNKGDLLSAFSNFIVDEEEKVVLKKTNIIKNFKTIEELAKYIPKNKEKMFPNLKFESLCLFIEKRYLANTKKEKDFAIILTTQNVNKKAYNININNHILFESGYEVTKLQYSEINDIENSMFGLWYVDNINIDYYQNQDGEYSVSFQGEWKVFDKKYISQYFNNEENLNKLIKGKTNEEGNLIDKYIQLSNQSIEDKNDRILRKKIFNKKYLFERTKYLKIEDIFNVDDIIHYLNNISKKYNLENYNQDTVKILKKIILTNILNRNDCIVKDENNNFIFKESSIANEDYDILIQNILSQKISYLNEFDFCKIFQQKYKKHIDSNEIIMSSTYSLFDSKWIIDSNNHKKTTICLMSNKNKIIKIDIEHNNLFNNNILPKTYFGTSLAMLKTLNLDSYEIEKVINIIKARLFIFDDPYIKLNDGTYKKDNFSVTIENETISSSIGPALEWENGDKIWMKNGTIHRYGNPAIIKSNGEEIDYIYGENFSIKNIQENLNFEKIF